MSTPISMPKGYKALGAFPIDASTLFSSLSALQTHAAGTTSYAGQICSVVENNVVTVYKVNSDKSLTPIDTTSAQVNADWGATTGVAQIFNKPGNFGAATSSANGTAGFVPAPAAGHNGRFLRGDASWADIPVPNLPTGTQLTYAEIFNSNSNASITTQLLGATGLPNSTGAGNWVPVVDTNPSIYEIADKSSDVTFNKGTGALTFAAKAATTVYQFIATIGCFKGESGSNGVDIGLSIDGADPSIQHYTSIPTPGFTTTQREISVSGVFELSPGVQHTVRLMVRQSGGGATGNAPTNPSNANSISMRTLNLNISSINALVAATVFGGVTSVNGQTPNASGAVTVALPQPSSVNPPPSAVAPVIGTSTAYARADHAHPADLIDAVHIVGQPDSVSDGVYFRYDTILGYPAYKKVSPDGTIVFLEVEVGSGPERWGVLVPSTGETLYRSTNLSSFPWNAAGWTTVDALGAFDSISQARAGVAAKHSVAIVTTGSVEQSGPIVVLDPVAESGDYNDLVNTPTEFVGANATDPGSEGLVPTPLAGDNTKFLRGDGTWATASPTPTVSSYNPFSASGSSSVTSHAIPNDIRNHFALYTNSTGLNVTANLPTSPQEGDTLTVSYSASIGTGTLTLSGGQPSNVVLQLKESASFVAESSGGTVVWMLVLGSLQADWSEVGDSNPRFIRNKPGNFGAATPTADGTAGFVPAPLAGDNTKFLRGDGTWAEGVSGPPGEDGQDGENGASVLNGTSDPLTQNNIGKDGDFYLNTATNRLFGPRVSGSWGSGVSLVGPAGTNGTNGTNGTAVLSGPGNPLTTQGAVGDFYINTTTNFIFGPKPNASAWGSSVSLVGPAGTNGTNGTAATVAVGTVSTGTAGSAAAVTNSGTSSAAVLNFTIPRGANGLAGPSVMLKIAGPGVGQWPSFGTLPNANTQPSVEYLFPWNFVEYNGDNSLYDADPTNIARNIRINASPAGEWFLIAARYASFDLNATNHFMRVRLRRSTSAITTATAGSLEALIAQTRTITATNGEAFVAGQVPIRLFGTTFLALTFLHDGPVGFPVNNNDTGTQPFIYITKLGN